MIDLQLEKKHYTFEEYLLLEEQATEKHEYHNGEILQMSGGTVEHGVISGRIVTALNNELDSTNKNCIVANSDVKIFIESVNHGVYPDAMMYCGGANFYKNNNAIITNPLLIAEILSESVDVYDKFEKYRTIPSFREYMLVWQTIPKVQTWYKMEENVWRISSAFGLDASIYLFTLGQTIALSDIYKRVNGLGEEDNWEAW